MVRIELALLIHQQVTYRGGDKTVPLNIARKITQLNQEALLSPLLGDFISLIRARRGNIRAEIKTEVVPSLSVNKFTLAENGIK